MNRKKAIHFFSFNEPNYSRAGTFLSDELLSKPSNVFHLVPTGIVQSIRFLRIVCKTIEPDSTLVVLSGSSVLVIYLYLLGLPKKNIVLDLGWTAFEASCSRRYGVKKPFRLSRIYLQELLSLHLSSIIFVESQAQKSYIKTRFVLFSNTIYVLATGVNENALNSIRLNSQSKASTQPSYFLFRGKNVAESGLDCLAKASWFLREGIRLLVITDSLNGINFNSRNTEVMLGFQKLEVLKDAYLNSLAVIGQLSDSRRLRRTIPHKAFEAAYFSKAYVTMNSPGVIELFGENSLCLVCGSKPENVAQTLEKLFDNKEVLAQKGRDFNSIYMAKYSQKKLQEEFLARISLQEASSTTG